MDCDRQVSTIENHSVLDIAHSYLLNSVAAKANEIDNNPDALMQALRGLGELGLLTLRVPRQWNGKEVDEETFSNFQELVARYSGALAFLQTQHQSAAAMLVASSNDSLRREYLPRMGYGEVLVGVGFSQLRRTGEPLTVAKPVTGGYQLDGIVPWVTGWGMFDDFIVAATLPDGDAVFGIVPLKETEQDSAGKITFKPPSQLAAMTSTNTVAANFHSYFLPQEYVVSIKPVGWIHENDKNNILRATFLATGCALGGLDIIKSALDKKSLPFISHAFGLLEKELNHCRTAIRQAQKNTGITLAKKLQLRAWAIELATRIAHAAVTVSSGAANYLYHPAQRLYREALVFTVTGQNTAVMEATLKQLTRGWGMDKDRETGGDGDAESVFDVSSLRNITYSRIIHLSHVIDTDIPQWQGDPSVEFETVAQLETEGYYLRRFSLGEHSATHINAPKSFDNSGVGIDQYTAESLVVPAVLINICKQVANNPDYTLSVTDIWAWEEEYGKIPSGNVVLLYTGWQSKWSDRTAFMNQDAHGNIHFPGFGSDATKFLVDERHIAGVGIDTHGVDSGQDTTFATNSLVLKKPRIVLENLTNLDQLPPKGATLAIGILRLRDGSGSPAGVMAFC